MKERWIQFCCLMVIGAGALIMSDEAKAGDELPACQGQMICNLGCPGNISLFCEGWAGCTPANPEETFCLPSVGCGGVGEFSFIYCGGAS